VGVERFATDEHRRQALLDIFRRILDRILSHGQVISKAELNSMGMNGTSWHKDVDVELFARLGRALIKLLERDTHPDDQSLPIEVW